MNMFYNFKKIIKNVHHLIKITIEIFVPSVVLKIELLFLFEGV